MSDLTPAEREQKIKQMEATGHLDPNCSQCKPRYDDPNVASRGGPSHKASNVCRSGGRPHCTCRACF